MEKILEQILGELRDIKIGQGRLENKMDSFRSSIVKDLTPYIENVEKHIEGSKNEIHERFDRLDRQVRLIDADLDGLNTQVQKNKRDIEKLIQN
jgi:hemerythrin-like domain-containing protein